MNETCVNRGQNFPELELQVVMIYHVSAGKQPIFSVRTVNTLNHQAIFLGPEFVYF